MTEGEKARSIRLILKSRLEDVFLAGLAIRGICSHVPLGEVAAYQVEVCIVEAVNNVIKHAYGNEEGHELTIGVTVHWNRIDFEVRDAGLGMIPQFPAEKPFDPDDLENIPEGGMGLQIIHSVMDEVVYEKTGRENVLRMSKYFEPREHAGLGKPS